MKEVELKVALPTESALRALEGRLSGVQRSDVLVEEDIYYTNAYKDFIETEECLRIRSRAAYSELTWKAPTTREMTRRQQYWKEELNIDISDRVEAFRELLRNLEFIEYVVVRKTRCEYKIDNNSKIVVDNVDGVGYFVEIETFADDEEAATARNEQILNEFGLLPMPRIFKPYRDLVKEAEQSGVRQNSA